MIFDRHLTSLPWSDYELLDSGSGEKLERFGAVIVARPETQALWKKRHPDLWESAHARFSFEGAKGAWERKPSVPASWRLSWNDIRFVARLTGFKHTGVFPEQAPNWQWLSEHLGRTTSRVPQVLNLFGYTGIASIIAAQKGAFITHVDASRQSLDWARENAELTGVSEDAIRWILDDAFAFAKREARRGVAYDGIILDPPAFGRGAKGEVWKIETDFTPLLDILKKIFNDQPGSFFLANGYAAGYAPRSFAQAIESVFGETAGECGELYIKESTNERVIPSGMYVRFMR
ncbi:class I SAM-dependent methyltransferase [Patescibacteria group bacterium]|nr:class I SAM-dependent methyltransferase [Patescibacteria group bacterium]